MSTAAALATALQDAGGASAPASALAQLRGLLLDALHGGSEELGKPRSGYADPVTVAFAAPEDGSLLAALPLPAKLHADPGATSERGWLLAAATVGTLVELAGDDSQSLALTAGPFERDFLALALPATAAPMSPAELDELASISFDGHVRDIDRLRARAAAVPAALLTDPSGELRAPIGAGHPLRIAEAVARLGGNPANPRSVEDHEDAVLALAGAADGAAARPHEDADPARRIARRILQRLNGMGKWGGYHTEFSHLPRGFAGNDRALAQAVGEALLESGLLAEKPSVGQRHVYLNPRRVADIHRLIEDGTVPSDLRLPAR